MDRYPRCATAPPFLSRGVGALISLYKRAHANGGTVSFVGLVDQPLVIFKLLKLDYAFALT